MMSTRTKQPAKSKSRRGPRASWRGNLAFGLVTFPVQAINALNRQQSDIHFHLLHADCHRRIHYQKVCPVHGEVSQDEIVSGYEIKRGKYVEVSPEVLESVRTEQERALTIDAFIDPDAVDPLYFDGRMYYLVPDGQAAAEPYAVLLTAMRRENSCGIGRIVFSGKDQLVLLRPLEQVPQMAMLNFDEEVNPPEDVLASRLPQPSLRSVKLAQTLVRNWSEDDFDFTRYDDDYRERVQELIAAKVEGRELVVPADQEPPPVVNLMDALKKSLQSREADRTSARRHPARKRRKTG